MSIPTDILEYQVAEYLTLEDLYHQRNISQAFKRKFESALSTNEESIALFINLDDPVLFNLYMGKLIDQENNVPPKYTWDTPESQIRKHLDDIVYKSGPNILIALLDQDINLDWHLDRYNEMLGNNPRAVAKIIQKLRDNNYPRSALKAMYGVQKQDTLLSRTLLNVLIREGLLTDRIMDNMLSTVTLEDQRVREVPYTLIRYIYETFAKYHLTTYKMIEDFARHYWNSPLPGWFFKITNDLNDRGLLDINLVTMLYYWLEQSYPYDYSHEVFEMRGNILRYLGRIQRTNQ